MKSMDLLVQYAFSFIKTPYVYGDKSPVVGGYDCSGFVSEVLRFAGLVGNKEVLNSQMLYEKFAKKPGSKTSRSAGALAFYGTSTAKITHVAFMVSNTQILEAGGGDSATKSTEIADKSNAMVRGRLVDYRADLVAVILPSYESIES